MLRFNTGFLTFLNNGIHSSEQNAVITLGKEKPTSYNFLVGIKIKWSFKFAFCGFLVIFTSIFIYNFSVCLFTIRTEKFTGNIYRHYIKGPGNNST